MVFIREQENRRVRVNIDPVNIRRRSSADGKQEVLQDFYAFPDIDVPLMSDEDHKAEMQEETKEREEGFLAPLDTAINPFAKEFDQTAYVRYLQKEMRKPTDELGQVRLNEDVIAAAQLLAPESSAQAIAILEAENEKLIPGRGKPLPKDPRKDSKFDTDTDYSVAGPSDLEETSDLAPSVDPPASIGVEVIDMVGRPIPTPAERQTIVDAVDAEEVLQPGQIDI